MKVKGNILRITGLIGVLGAIVFAVFAYQDPINMMSQSYFNNWHYFEQVWLSGFMPGFVIGMGFICIVTTLRR